MSRLFSKDQPVDEAPIDLPAMTERGLAGQIMDAAWPEFGGNALPAEYWQAFNDGVLFALRAVQRAQEPDITRRIESHRNNIGNDDYASMFFRVTVYREKQLRRVSLHCDKLLAAAKLQHDAIDGLFAQIIPLDPKFRPTQSAAWPAITAGKAAIDQAEGRT